MCVQRRIEAIFESPDMSEVLEWEIDLLIKHMDYFTNFCTLHEDHREAIQSAG